MADPKRSTLSKLLWFADLWLAGVATVTLVAVLIRTMIRAG